MTQSYTEYHHEPLTDFTVETNRLSFEAGIQTVNGYLRQEYDLFIDGKRIRTNDKIISYNPANKDEVVGIVSKANGDLAEQAMEAASHAFERWRKWSPEARAGMLFRAAAEVRRR